MRPAASRSLSNILIIARREFVARATTRTFGVTTLLLVLAAAIVALAPVVIGYLDRDAGRVAIYVGTADLRGDPETTVEALLNPASGRGGGPALEVTRTTALEASRRQVIEGTLTALLEVARDARGEPVFTVYVNDPSGSTAVIARQAAASLALADRLGRLGIAPASQADLLTPPQVTIRPPDLSKPALSSLAVAQAAADTAVIVALEMFVLLAIMFYGVWIAQSVVEEKSSRMMEIILATVSPFQLLAGKVLGVSAAAMLQFGAIVAATVVALLAQGSVAAAVFGDAGGVTLPTGLTPSLLVAFAAFFVLGFLLYAVLFAAAGSLVSRQEDVSQMVAPMTLVACGAYLVAMYASLGSISINAAWVVALSWVPFFSPYLMLSRLSAATVSPLEVAVAALLVAGSIGLGTWIAARIYAAGVLVYGQKPSLRRLWTAAHTGR